MYQIINNPPINKINSKSFFNFEYSSDEYGLFLKNRNENYSNLPGKTPIDYRGFIVIPPVAVERSNKYELVIGKEIADYVCRKYSFIPQLLLITGIDNEKELFRIILILKKFMFGLNPIEKATVLERAIKLFGETPKDILSMLEIPNNRIIINKYLRMNKASDKIKSLVASGVVDPQTIFRIFIFPVDQWDELAIFVSQLRIGTKYKNKLLEMIHEISLRDGINPTSLIKGKEVKRIFELEMDSPQKAKKIFSYFEDLRYPTIKRYRNSFQRKLREIGFKDDLNLSYDPTFEKRDFKISFSFSSIDEFKVKVQKLSKISGEEKLRELFE